MLFKIEEDSEIYYSFCIHTFFQAVWLFSFLPLFLSLKISIENKNSAVIFFFKQEFYRKGSISLKGKTALSVFLQNQVKSFGAIRNTPPVFGQFGTAVSSFIYFLLL